MMSRGLSGRILRLLVAITVFAILVLVAGESSAEPSDDTVSKAEISL